MEFRDAKFYAQPTLFREDRLRGKVEVIAVPFVDGGHICKNVEQALMIVRSLKELHDAGFVHGDIRGLNVVFSHDSSAQFIDYDFGGKRGEVNYPPGYKCCLLDGYRVSAEEEKPIEVAHDVKALVFVLTNIHRVCLVSGDSSASPDPAASAKEDKIFSLEGKLRRAKTLDIMEEILRELAAIIPGPKCEFKPEPEYAKYIGNVVSTERPAVTPDRRVSHPKSEKRQKPDA